MLLSRCDEPSEMAGRLVFGRLLLMCPLRSLGKALLIKVCFPNTIRRTLWGGSRNRFATRLRPIQRDGGQRLEGFSGDIFWDLRGARHDAVIPDYRLAP